MRIEDDVKLDFNDVLIKPKRSDLGSRRDVKLTRKFDFRYGKAQFKGVPIMASNMDGVGTFSMAAELYKHQMFTCIRKHYTIEDWINYFDNNLLPVEFWNYISVSTGSNAIWVDDAPDYKLVKDVTERFPVNYITIDVANGYQENFVEFVSRVREDYPDKVIIAGNVITAEMVEALILAGADIVKCGIGPGSVCTTRIKAGVGYPQLSGIIECADAAHGLKGGKMIADGGCVYPGDVAKAFGANADFVMLGGMLAGYSEGEYTEAENGKVLFYGMSSDEAMARHGARKDGYRSAEGRVIELPYRGHVEKAVEDILGGLRSTCTYIGAHSLKEVGKCTTFVRVNSTHNLAYAQYDTGRT